MNVPHGYTAKCTRRDFYRVSRNDGSLLPLEQRSRQRLSIFSSWRDGAKETQGRPLRPIGRQWLGEPPKFRIRPSRPLQPTLPTLAAGSDLAGAAALGGAANASAHADTEFGVVGNLSANVSEAILPGGTALLPAQSSHGEG